MVENAVKAFEESVFGPGAVGRTFGSWPEPLTERGGETCQIHPAFIASHELRSIGGNVHMRSTGRYTPTDDFAMGFSVGF